MSFLRHSLLPLATALAVALGVWLHWPSVDSGFRGDDYVQAAMLRGRFAAPRSPLDLFSFASGEAADTRALQDFGYLPWWSAPELRLRMWRPIASALLATDHALFGAHARPQHLHSLAWLVAMLLAAALLLRELLPAPSAALALLFFAVEEGHTIPVAWLANRSTLIATTFGFLACAAHVRTRTRGLRYGPFWVGLLSSAALLSGEYSFTALAYLASYEVFAAPGTLRERARASTSWALPVLLYVLLHAALGRDAVGSGYYISPTASPLAFLAALCVRVPVLLADLVFAFPSSYYNTGSPFRQYVLAHGWFSPELWHRLPEWTTGHALIGWAALGAYALLLRTLDRQLPATERPVLRCLGLGTLLSLVPCVGALPGDRLLGGAALGACAVGATLLVRLPPLAATRLGLRTRLVRALLCGWTLWALGVQSAARAHAQSAWFAHESDALRVWSLDADLPVRDAAQQRVYVIAAADFTTSTNLPWIRLLHGLPLPRSYRRLMPGSEPLDLRRIDSHTLELTVLTGDVLGDATPSLYRDARHPVPAGLRVRQPGLTVTVERTLLGNPFVVRFDFDQDLDDERLWLLQATWEGLRRVHVPPVGETQRLPKPPLRDLRVIGRNPAGAAAE